MKKIIALIVLGAAIGCSGSNHYVYSPNGGYECGHYRREEGTWRVFNPEYDLANDTSFDTEQHAREWILKGCK